MAPIFVDSIFAEMVNSNGSIPLQLFDFPGQKTVRDLKKAISLKLGKTDRVSDIEVAFGVHDLTDREFKCDNTKVDSNSGQWTERLHPTMSRRYLTQLCVPRLQSLTDLGRHCRLRLLLSRPSDGESVHDTRHNQLNELCYFRWKDDNNQERSPLRHRGRRSPNHGKANGIPND